MDEKRIFLFTGKGGVGKSTLSKAYFQKLKKSGTYKFLSLDINDKDNDFSINKILIHYLEKRIKSKVLSKLVIESSLFQSIISLLPGFCYNAFWGHLLDQLITDKNTNYIIDAHSSGHLFEALNAPFQFQKIFSMGVLSKDCLRIINELYPQIKIFGVYLSDELTQIEIKELEKNLKSLTPFDFNFILNQSIQEHTTRPKSKILKSILTQETKSDIIAGHTFPLVLTLDKEEISQKLQEYIS